MSNTLAQPPLPSEHQPAASVNATVTCSTIRRTQMWCRRHGRIESCHKQKFWDIGCGSCGSPVPLPLSLQDPTKQVVRHRSIGICYHTPKFLRCIFSCVPTILNSLCVHASFTYESISTCMHVLQWPPSLNGNVSIDAPEALDEVWQL